MRNTKHFTIALIALSSVTTIISSPAIADYRPFQLAMFWNEKKDAGAEFNDSLGEFRNNVKKLGDNTQDAVKRLDQISKYSLDDAKEEAKKYREEIENLRRMLTPDGDITKKANKVLSWVDSNMDRIRKDNEMSPEYRQNLLNVWGEQRKEVEQKRDELREAGRKLGDLLKDVISNQRYIEEMAILEKAKEAVDIMRKLVNQINDATDNIDRQLEAVKLKPMS